LTASDIGKSSKSGLSLVGNPPGALEMFSSTVIHSRQEHGPKHYGLSAAALPSAGSGPEATYPELLTLSARRHGAAILLTDQRDASERVGDWTNSGATKGDPDFGIGRQLQFQFAGCGIVR
jgi:hypothetical protein